MQLERAHKLTYVFIHSCEFKNLCTHAQQLKQEQNITISLYWFTEHLPAVSSAENVQV